MKRLTFLLVGGAFALSLPIAALAAPVKLGATLDGASETDGGNMKGAGTFAAEIDPDTGDVCYKLAVSGIGDVMAAHIHEGAAGSNGKPVFAIEVTGANDDLCIAVEPDTLKPILATPANYYVNVHTKDFPKGAIRGQLASGN